MKLSFVIIFIINMIYPGNISAGTIVEFIGKQIPEKYYIGQQYIFYQSDSLYLNGHLLVRDADYKYLRSLNSFDLTSLNINKEDTLRISYTLLPAWLKTKFGREIPSTNTTHPGSGHNNHEEEYRVVNDLSSDIDISGAKSFRFNTASIGGSNFSQTLDLSIAGNLTEQLEITGSISDRGYDPAYGTANSRLNELDKINLQIKSDNFTGSIGDILYTDRFASGTTRDKRISGVSAAYLNRAFDIHATASRPRGQYQTIKLSGVDQLQGPYQINSNGGPVVPGSEQVWLDGKMLERGTNKDYLIDYSVGNITFNVNHAIDQRSRIEIDYEPQAGDFKGELFSGGGGVSLGDSSVVVEVEWLREGDDRNQPLAGDLSNTDKIILQEVGDNIDQGFRSGITVDTNGNYILISDSLPDSVFQFVESGTGYYSISFSYVGDNNGDYKFIGNNIYQFTGVAKGDYLPVVIIPAAERIDQYLARVSISNNILGNVYSEVRLSDYDKNLFSNLNDNDNTGGMYTISLNKNWRESYNPDYYNLNFRLKEINYRTRSRIYNADFSRDYLLPSNYIPASDESRYGFESSVGLTKQIRITPYVSRLNYDNELDSWRGGMSLSFIPHDKIKTDISINIIRVDYDRPFGKTTGEMNNYSAGLDWNFNRKWTLRTKTEFDRRLNTYTGMGNGTRYLKLTAEIDHITERLRFERFDEDSLSGQWEPSLLWHRISLESNRQLGNLNYSSILSYQWLDKPDIKEENFLGQLILRYNNVRHRFSFNSTYILSDETRKARGISYFKVKQGEGDYIFEDGEYRPEPEGDYIKVEEILSEQAKVSRGEKIFGLTKSWDIAMFRFDSRHNEELMDGENRNGWWVIPFISDNSKAYLFYTSHYNFDLKLFPVMSFYALSFGLSEDTEIRNISNSQREKKNRSGSATLKQALSKTLFEESLEIFKNQQNEYYNRGGDIDGYISGISVRQSMGLHEITIGIKYRKAEDKTDEKSEIYSIISSSRWSVINNGEIRSSIELYSQSLNSTGSNAVSYILTDNRPGDKGAIWSLGLRYGLKKSIRINFNISGRHADNRTARVTARGEMVAGF
ncbi:MAG: hypothetical protein ABIJ12_11820 [bacterium]